VRSPQHIQQNGGPVAEAIISAIIVDSLVQSLVKAPFLVVFPPNGDLLVNFSLENLEPTSHTPLLAYSQFSGPNY
jgi:hypothetical protein